MFTNIFLFLEQDIKLPICTSSTIIIITFYKPDYIFINPSSSFAAVEFLLDNNNYPPLCYAFAELK